MTTSGSDSELGFIAFLKQLIPSLPEYAGQSVSVDEEDDGADLVVWTEGQPAIVEAKSDTPKTPERLKTIVEQLQRTATTWRNQSGFTREPRLVLAVPGILSGEHPAILHARGVTVWDGPVLTSAATASGTPLPPGMHLTTRFLIKKPPAMVLRRRLHRTPLGREYWLQYQRWCSDLLAYLFCPPLEAPLTESANATRINRRDIILPNYAQDGIWAFLRFHYRADHIVVDAKNTQSVTKNHVLQLGNYLSYHGAGLLGFILSRREPDFAAKITRQEQWVLHNKMIIFLNDDDARTMIASKESGEDPAVVVRQRIEDFRLGM